MSVEASLFRHRRPLFQATYINRNGRLVLVPAFAWWKQLALGVIIPTLPLVFAGLATSVQHLRTTLFFSVACIGVCVVAYAITRAAIHKECAAHRECRQIQPRSAFGKVFHVRLSMLAVIWITSAGAFVVPPVDLVALGDIGRLYLFLGLACILVFCVPAFSSAAREAPTTLRALESPAMRRVMKPAVTPRSMAGIGLTPSCVWKSKLDYHQKLTEFAVHEVLLERDELHRVGPRFVLALGMPIFVPMFVLTVFPTVSVALSIPMDQNLIFILGLTALVWALLSISNLIYFMTWHALPLLGTPDGADRRLLKMGIGDLDKESVTRFHRFLNRKAVSIVSVIAVSSVPIYVKYLELLQKLN